ncbi:MAG: hypothetical protein JO317_01495, partial [Verrucomicrobiae bacterium]|nr:hypothetical protein [Verrucomicrobiae bacterium]
MMTKKWAFWMMLGCTAQLFAAEQVFVCKESIDQKVHHGDQGAALRLDYNVNNGGAFNGFWMKLGPSDKGNNFDASKYKTLTFWLRGDESAGIPSKVKVELKNDEAISKKYVESIKPQWTKISIPLSEFASQGVDLTKLNELTIVFEQKEAAPATVGAVYVDDITLEGGSQTKVLADFNAPAPNNVAGNFGAFAP